MTFQLDFKLQVSSFLLLGRERETIKFTLSPVTRGGWG